MTQIARQLRHEMTPAEARVWDAVRNRQCGGLRFLRQHDLGGFVLDFYCAAARAAIEIDGSIHNGPIAREHDLARETALRETYHIRFIRLTNTFVLATPPDTLRGYLLKRLTDTDAPAPYPSSVVTPTP